MKLDIDGLTVYFPYDYVYPEQYQYMLWLKEAIDTDNHCMLEMPSGTGKTVCLLALLVSYMEWKPCHLTKVIYCSRTVSEVDKVIEELKNLVAYIETERGQKMNILGVALSARKNMCINDSVLSNTSGNVDASCRGLTASFVRARKEIDGNVNLCNFFEEFDQRGREETLPFGIYSLDDLKDYGRKEGLCPYFITRYAITHANIVVYSYYYLLDPKIANLVSKDLPKTSVVIFDEAHNIDNVCIDAMSCVINRKTISTANTSLKHLKEAVVKATEFNKSKLDIEYEKLKAGLKLANEIRMEDLVLTNPTLSDDIINEAIPGSIRKTECFLIFFQRFLSFIEMKLRINSVVYMTPALFLKECANDSGVTRHPLKFCSERLQSILHYLEISDLVAYQTLIRVANFATMVSTYIDGFSIIIEPFDERTPTVKDPVLHFTCVDSAFAIKPILARFNTVVITSGTLSPMDMYAKILGIQHIIKTSLSMSLARNCVKPLIVTKGKDQMSITTKFENREDPPIIRNYGLLLLEMARVVPDGIVAFFPSYAYMESTFLQWYNNGITSDIQKHKLICIETQDSEETNVALQNYKKACENGRGAIFLSVARGKVSEGIDFDHHLGRCVIMFGIPFFFAQSRIIKARLTYLKDNFHISENDFINFDAMRHTAQCLGRVIRGKTDYGLMILADKRFMRFDKRSKLPEWILHHLPDCNLNLSTEEAVQIAKRFLAEMGQEFDYEAQFKMAAFKKIN